MEKEVRILGEPTKNTSFQFVRVNRNFESLSVLDKVVPGYYYRFDDRGAVHTDACCPEIMTENKMVEKLMIDAMVTWARHYKVDGFRFDIMGDPWVDALSTQAVDGWQGVSTTGEFLVYAVPEPSTYALGLGLVALFLCLRRRRG
jgi:glycosidase